MIRADEPLCGAFGFSNERRTAMAAGVLECADLVIGATAEGNRLVELLKQPIRTRLAQLAGMANAKPSLPQNMLQFKPVE
jgi:hypothetical protein